MYMQTNNYFRQHW